MRVFAGPNGSGKTTIFKTLLSENKIDLGVYVNADEIEELLQKSASIPFSEFQLQVSNTHLRAFFKSSTFSPVKRNEPDLWQKLEVKDNSLLVTTKIDSYLAADLAEYIRQGLLDSGVSFTYETVMSHPHKVRFMQLALEKGYRVYLYYIATEDPEINISRVNVRVAQHGHAVLPEIIKNRYYKSLENLNSAVKSSSRAYVFDNSGKQAQLIAEISDGFTVTPNEAVSVPNWVANHLLG